MSPIRSLDDQIGEVNAPTARSDTMPVVHPLAGRFRDFARTAAPRAPLYVRLSAGVAEDPELCALLDGAPPGQQVPVLLFAAVHDLVLRGDAPDLAASYPTAAGVPLPPETAFASFRAACMDHTDHVRRTVATRSTQTNEVGRCALFLPALAMVTPDVGPLALIDVGASAGLNLLLDRYAYRYTPGGDVGGPSPVVLGCGIRGEFTVPAALPPLGADLPHAVAAHRVRRRARSPWRRARRVLGARRITGADTRASARSVPIRRGPHGGEPGSVACRPPQLHPARRR